MYRPVIMGKNGLVTSANPLASMAGLAVLKEGGNAFDAAVAVSAVLGVVQPHVSGIGGDALFLLYCAADKEVYFLNGSGRSPFNSGIDSMQAYGYERIPARGVLSVTVPGCVDAWGEIWKRFGSITFKRLLQPAVNYAARGFPVSHYLAKDLEKYKEVLRYDSSLCKIFMPTGNPVKAGSVLKQENLAETLKTLGHEGPQAFYEGETATAIHNYMVDKNGLLTKRDLSLHTSTWAEPIASSYGKMMIYQTPPNTQGLATLLAFNIMDGLEIEMGECGIAQSIHYMVEGIKKACRHRDQYIADPDFVPTLYEEFLDKQYAVRLRKMISPFTVRESVYEGVYKEEMRDCGSYYAIADADGNVASGIQSLYSPFGAGCMIEETGIILQNRGASFSLDPCHINRLEPCKRSCHTLTASLVLQDGFPVIVFGASGSDGQPQTHLQVLLRLIHSGVNIQEAIEAPRWMLGSIYPADSTLYLNVEGRFSAEVVGTLESWGHNIRLVDEWSSEVGLAQGMVIDNDTRVLMGGADPRAEGYAVAW